MINRLSEADLQYWLEISRGYGFLSPQSVDIQIRHARSFIGLTGGLSGSVLDLGAGGGLPGLVVLSDTDVYLTALDAMNKRTDFLTKVAQESDLEDRFKVVNGRAEELAFSSDLEGRFDFVIARGFGSPAVTAECSVRYLKSGGCLIVSGRPEDEESRWSAAGLQTLGLRLDEVVGDDNAHAAIISKVDQTSKAYPRQYSLIKKSPLW